MRELVKIKDESSIGTRDIIIAVMQHVVAAFFGFTASRAIVMQTMLPFGLSFVAGCPASFMPSVATGAFIGYFIPAIGNGAFRYIAAILAIIAIRLMLSAYRKISENPLFLCFICLLANIITSAVALNGLPISIIKVISETVLASVGTFFIYITGHALLREVIGFSGDELACMLIVISIMLMGISDIGILGISIGRIIGIWIILISAKYGGTLSGAVSGIAFAFSAVLTGTDETIGIIYSFGGMMAGVFSSFGKYAQLVAFAATAFIGIGVGGFGQLSAVLIVELMLAFAVFTILPRNVGIVLSKIFSSYPKISVPTGAKKAITMRLSMAAGALGEVSQTVEQVAHELSKINSPDFGMVIAAIEEEACSGCKLRLHCWESRREETTAAIIALTGAIKTGEADIENSTSVEFKGRCVRFPAVAEAVKKNYSDYAAKISAENRIDEVRSVVSDQFDGISDMLLDLAADFDGDGRYDSVMAMKAAAALKNINIMVSECSCEINRFGRITIELRVKRGENTIFNRLHIMKAVSIACERNFDVPNISEVGLDVFISISERAVYKVDIGVSQSCCSKSNMCGDAYNYFNDGRGHFIAVLSDGMGTGGRAAVDGAMASGLMSRLLKAGFGYDCSLRILNFSMLFKSTDESLATVDITSIDLFTGEVQLYKAGAAPTIVRRSGRTGKAQSTSLPIGILREIGFDKATIRICEGDIVLMMSDGAISEGTDWIRSELEAFGDGTAEELAERICRCAFRRRTDNHEDDITVMAAIVSKAI